MFKKKKKCKIIFVETIGMQVRQINCERFIKVCYIVLFGIQFNYERNSRKIK